MANSTERPPLRQAIPGDVLVREVLPDEVTQAGDDFRAFTVKAEGRTREWGNCFWDDADGGWWWHWLAIGDRVAKWRGDPPPVDA